MKYVKIFDFLRTCDRLSSEISIYYITRYAYSCYYKLLVVPMTISEIVMFNFHFILELSLFA